MHRTLLPRRSARPLLVALACFVGGSVSGSTFASPRGIPDVNDLPALQAHLQELGPRLVAATVGIRVAGESSMGSGVLVGEHGLILSAAHVLAGTGTALEIYLADGRQLAATALGMDHQMDVGLAQIDAEGTLAFAPLGYPEELQPGDWALATGHAGGIFPSRPPPLRIGRILYLDLDEEVGMGMGLVTSCTMVSGDSGGPLFDLGGRVIGIHSTIGMSTDQNQHATLRQAELLWEDFLGGIEIGEPVRERSSQSIPSEGIFHRPREAEAPNLQQLAGFAARALSAGRFRAPDPVFRDVVRTASASTVQVFSAGERVALGAVVSERGEVVTKASCLGEDLEVQLPGGERLVAARVASDEATDLALLRVEADGWVPVAWVEQRAGPGVGTVLVTPGKEGAVLGPGVVSVPVAPIPEVRISILGDLGGGASSGLEQVVSDLSQQAGELSERSAPFSAAFTHDTVLWARDCGGPVVGIDGRALGINIARPNRIATYAIPAATVLDLLRQWRTNPHAEAPFEFRF